MNKLFKSLMSMRTVILLLFIFGVVSGVATFVENDFGTEAAWSIIYTSWWFAAIQVALAILLIYNIFKYKMYKFEKLPAFLFHLGFIVILIGAGVTRYFGYEGILHIRNGMSADRMLSNTPYVTVSAIKGDKKYETSLKKLLSTISNNQFDMKLDVAGDVANISFKKYIPNAVTKLVSDPKGVATVTMLVSVNGRPDNVTLRKGQVYEAGNNLIAFDAPVGQTTKNVIQIYVKNNKFYIDSAKAIGWFRMADRARGGFAANQENEWTTGKLYTVGAINIAPRQMLVHAKEKIVSETNPMFNRPGMKLSALTMNVTYKGKSEDVTVFGRGKGAKGIAKKVVIAGTPFEFEWGSRTIKLPFKIKLLEFQLERYPGSMSPMSYASEVEVLDKANNVHMPYRIYMNHVLNYGGYRFFQSSYDQDEMGTILSVNKDPGKWPTYLGYFLLGLGLFFNLLNPKSRFRKLANMVQRDANKMKSLLMAFFIALSFFGANQAKADDQIWKSLTQFQKQSADNFGTILVQSADGRIKPIDTLSTDILNKVYRGTNYKGLDSNQVILGMIASPQEWQTQKMIYVFHPTIKKILGMKADEKYATFNQFFVTNNDGGSYKLAKYAEEASRKKPSARNKFDKDVLKVDERLNICYMVYTGDLLKIIPKINDQSNKWFSPKQALTTFPKSEANDVRKLLSEYFNGIAIGLKSGNWSDADDAIGAIKKYQVMYASEIIPSKSKIAAEMFFNKARIFQRLTPVYLLSGLILLMFVFAKMLKPKLNIKIVTKIMFWIILLGFAAHTIGLILRGYIDGHAPWSNGYESMIYIAWAITLSGIFFSRQAVIALSLTSILAGVTLFVAHLSWMDPQITTLVPVLNSYWLDIHVSVITASYGFLGLCALLGFFTLILFIFRQPKADTIRAKEIDRSIIEATRINEMAMILGLSLLTIGNFLGGVWANESWGRYWGWDPKETWALVSILIFASVVHFRFVPKLSNPFAFAVASTLAYASIIMTYFGVNFYLSGMHSYATGDPVPIPTFVYYTVATVFAVIVLAFRNRHMDKKL
ncbi:cytochrome c biogenesis protein CcsA [Sulfurospirillum sp. 1612]|uniref:cytochrome c biogenesis protein CcsA n=1 Tax=Sulfurospirillum sp. 1612 TaxID=3094835 RepID=UPI002F94FEAC